MKDRIVARLSMVRRTSLLGAMVIGVGALSLVLPAAGALAADKSRLLTEVHFDPGSIDISLGGQKKIEKAIADIKKQNPREIHVIGFTDSTGDSALNLVISRDRADNVARMLSVNGINVPLVIEGKGENGAPYKIPDDVSEPLNRCVGIIAVGEARQPTL